MREIISSPWLRRGGLLVLFASARMITVAGAPVVRVHADRISYYHDARVLAWTDVIPFLTDAPQGRPPVYPMFLKLCGFTGDETAPALLRSVVLQSALSVLAFTLLACRLSRAESVSPAARAAMVTILLLFSMSSCAAPWDVIPLTESINLSLFILLSLSFTAWLARPCPVRAVPTLAVLALSVWTRDANLFFPLCLAAAMIPFLPRPASLESEFGRVARPALILLCVLLTFGSYRSAVANQRDDSSLTYVLFMKVFTGADHFDRFVRDYDMPADVRPFIGRYEHNWWADYPDYERWRMERSRRAYLSFLVRCPSSTLLHARRSLRARAEELAALWRLAQYADPTGRARVEGRGMKISAFATKILASPIRALHAAGGAFAVWSVLAILTVALLRALHRRGEHAAFGLTIFLILVAANQYVMTSFFSGMEDFRHAMLAHGITLLLFYSAVIALIGELRRASSAPERTR